MGPVWTTRCRADSLLVRHVRKVHDLQVRVDAVQVAQLVARQPPPHVRVTVRPVILQQVLVPGQAQHHLQCECVCVCVCARMCVFLRSSECTHSLTCVHVCVCVNVPCAEGQQVLHSHQC